MTFSTIPFLLLSACLLSGCGASDPPPADSAPEAAAAPAPPPKEDKKSFDIGKVPVSDGSPGTFPHFSIPAGYETTPKLSSTVDRAIFPFWVGDDFRRVEGRLYQANIRAVEGTAFAALEVEKHISDQIEAAGGVLVASGVIPRGASGAVLTREFTREYSNGLCWPSEPVRTYLVRRSDRDVWVHACTYGGTGAAWVIVETDAAPPPEMDALSSGELKKRIDADGHVDVSVQFDSGSDRMMSGSQQQISAIVGLLEADPALALSINGHTDDTGTPERNLELSSLRARRVMEMLVERGIDATRLQSHGFGRERPVASNGTPAGRARNRRVELEKV